MAIAEYCVQDDIEDRISESGLDLRVDDTPTDANWAIKRASITINQYCIPRYSAAQLAASEVISEYAADIATYYYCTRRGNPAPAPVHEEYERLLEYLELIRLGKMLVTDARPHRGTMPAMSNVGIGMRPRFTPVVQTQTSVGKRAGKRRRDIIDPLQYNGDYVI